MPESKLINEGRYSQKENESLPSALSAVSFALSWRHFSRHCICIGWRLPLLLLLLKLHLLQLFQQLLWSLGLVVLLLLVLRSRRLLHRRRLHGSVLRLLVGSVLRHFFVAFLLCLRLLRILRWLWWLARDGARSSARSRR